MRCARMGRPWRGMCGAAAVARGSRRLTLGAIRHRIRQARNHPHPFYRPLAIFTGTPVGSGDLDRGELLGMRLLAPQRISCGSRTTRADAGTSMKLVCGTISETSGRTRPEEWGSRLSTSTSASSVRVFGSSSTRHAADFGTLMRRVGLAVSRFPIESGLEIQCHRPARRRHSRVVRRIRHGDDRLGRGLCYCGIGDQRNPDST